VRRLRAGEWVAAAGAAGLLVTLFLPWFGLETPARKTQFFGDDGVVNLLGTYSVGSDDGWSNLGWVTLAFALAAIGCAAWLAAATAVARPIAQQVAAGVLTATAGPLALLALALRTLIFQPGPNELIGTRYGAWLGLLAALALTVGGWWAIKDERTGAPESAYTPPEPRPAPPAA
jgi:hypothetical protein